MITKDCKTEKKIFYHGTSTRCGIDDKLLPPIHTDTLSEEGRLKNLDKVFFTEDLSYAKVYAGRACRQFGGEPVIYRVIPMCEVECLNDKKGATVFHSGWAFVEVLN